MHDLIRRILQGLSLLLAPGTGRRRVGARPTPTTPARRSDKALTTAVSHPIRLPLHRSPYGLHLPLDGTATRLVRPYLTAHEHERAQQQRRRLALVLAADFGIDLDRHLVGDRYLVGMPEVAV
ncbi:hypothetical protein [Streptomyces sp. NBC_00996]|uniref:hypothetical protein n=1 Tax=Streptomyces sp. NBC_00996 TaxID=2903710 RepID=UPI003863AEF9|nr:hypothetical protein OG390_21195 [Streptomyces sp. NBC_00996]